VNLGWMYEHGLGTERSPALALEWYRKAAAKGLPEGEFNAASLIEAGAGAPPDFAAAAAGYARAAQKNFAPANYRLGLLLEQKKVPAAEYGTALLRYRAAALAGLPDAQFAAARLLLDVGGTTNAREALDRLQQAARAGHAPAQVMLADAASQYRIARQLAADASGAAQALGWLRAAAEQNYRDAQLGLAIALEEGRGTARDPGGAASWYAKAAAAGNAEATYRLALLYDEGIGVPRDTVKARDLLGEAAALGHNGARQRFERLLGSGLPQQDGTDPFKAIR
jgi:TPR repeat protein